MSKSYRDLIVWQKAVELVPVIHKVTSDLPKEQHSTTSVQMNKAALTIPTSIAEGWGKQVPKNYLHCLRTARGALYELDTLVEIVNNMKLLEQENYANVSDRINEVGRVLAGLINSIKNKNTSDRSLVNNN